MTAQKRFFDQPTRFCQRKRNSLGKLAKRDQNGDGAYKNGGMFNVCVFECEMEKHKTLWRTTPAQYSLYVYAFLLSPTLF